MITPAYSITATERPLPSLMLDFTVASLDPRVTFTRALDTATTVNSSGYITTVNADTPRFWHDPITKVCQGLLIETSRQNELSYSNEFTNAVWGVFGGSVAADNVVSPDNTQNADTVTSTAVNTAIVRNFAIPVNTGTYCSTIFVKYLSGTANFRLRIALTGGTAVATFIAFNANTGAFVSSSSGAVYTITPYANGFWRISLLTTNNNTNTTLNYQIYPTNDATATNAMAIYGAQVEAGSFPTTYVPTTTAAALRNSDIAVMTGANFSSWANATQGTLNVEAVPTNIADQSMAFLSNGTNSNSLGATTVAGVFPSYRFESSSGSFNGSGTAAYVTGNIIKGAVTYASNLQTAAFNGTLVTGISSLAVVPTIDTLKIGADGAGTNLMTGYIRKLRYYTIQLTDSEIKALTT